MKKTVSVWKTLTLSALLVTPGLAQEPTLTWDASLELDGDKHWPSVQDPARSWTLEAPAIAQFGATEFPSAPVWFSGLAGDAFSLANNGGGKDNVSFEFVLRPVDLVGEHVIFETGGNNDGTAFVLSGANLEFRVQGGAVIDERVIAIHTFMAGDEAKFHHVVGTFTLGDAGTNEVQLFVNGGAPVATLGAIGNIDDWAGSDAAGLGKISSDVAIGVPGVVPFTGDIALFNYYDGTVLTQAQVQAKFDDLSSGSGVVDSEPNGLPDLWEQEFFEGLDPLSGDDEEPDGLTNFEELVNGSNPNLADTDGDGIDDGAELASVPPTLPTVADTDGDGLTDLEEGTHGTDPTDVDTDNDTFSDLLELENGFDPNDRLDPPAGHGTKVIWVTGNTDGPGPPLLDDIEWTELLRVHGYEVERRADLTGIDSDQEVVDEINAADLVIFSRDTSSGSYASNADEVEAWNSEVTVPLIQMNAFLVRSSRWKWIDSSSLDDVFSGNNAVVSDPEHPFFNDVVLDENGEFEILGSGEIDIISASDGGNATVLATESLTGNIWIAYWAKGREFYEGSGEVAGADRVWFGGGFGGTFPRGGENFSRAGETAFMNVVNVLTGQGPPLEIIDLSYDESSDRFSITWASVPGARYSLDYSEDLELDTNFDDAISATKETTTLEFANPKVGATRLFFQVSKVP